MSEYWLPNTADLLTSRNFSSSCTLGPALPRLFRRPSRPAHTLPTAARFLPTPVSTSIVRAGSESPQRAKPRPLSFGAFYNMPAVVLKTVIVRRRQFDGKVDINDLTIVLAHYGQTGMAWAQGEFTGDGTVDINDLTIVLAHYGQTAGASAGGISAVPEPSAVLFRRRRLTCSVGLWLAEAIRQRKYRWLSYYHHKKTYPLGRRLRVVPTGTCVRWTACDRERKGNFQ